MRAQYKYFKFDAEIICLLVEWERIAQAEKISDDIRVKMLDADIVVIRCDKTRSIRNLEEIKKKSEAFVKRFSNKEVYLLYSQNFEINLISLGSAKKGRRDTKYTNELIKKLQQLELLDILDSQKAIFPKTPPGTFVKSPSGSIVNTFIRTGNVQTSVEILDIFFFWLIPMLENIDSIILDTWTVSSIGLNISRRMSLYNAKGTGFRQPIYIDILSKYYGNDPTSIQELKKITNGLKSHGLSKPLFIFSACATGVSLEKLVDDVKTREKLTCSKFVALYSFDRLSDDSLFSLCTLESYLKDVDYADTGFGKPVFVIDEETYMPNILDVVNETSNKKINTDLLETSSTFFNRYVGCEAFTVHKSVTQHQGKHHAYYILMDKLIQHEKFLEKLECIIDEKFVTKKKVPTMILAADTDSSYLLAKKIREYFYLKIGNDSTITIFKEDKIADNKDLREKLQAAEEGDTLFIVEDVCVTGRTIGKYQGQLRDLNYRGITEIFVGVMRPESEETINNIKKYRTWARERSYPEALHCVETVLLPNWGEKNCPWCVEQRNLLKWVECISYSKIPENIKEMLEERLKILMREGADWIECFTQPIRVTARSFWIEGGEQASQADISCAVASGLQYFRDKGIDGYKLGAGYPNRVILSDTDLYGENWQNTVLQVAIWRAAKTGELQSVDYNKQDSRLSKLNDYLASPDPAPDVGDEVDRAKCYEVAVSILSQKIPHPINKIEVPTRLKCSPEVDFLTEVIKTSRQ